MGKAVNATKGSDTHLLVLTNSLSERLFGRGCTPLDTEILTEVQHPIKIQNLYLVGNDNFRQHCSAAAYRCTNSCYNDNLPEIDDVCVTDVLLRTRRKSQVWDVQPCCLYQSAQ